MPYILLSLAACFWGGNYVVGHILVADVNPIVLSAARWIFTALVLMTLYFRQVAEQWPMMKRSFGTIAFLALCGQVLFSVDLVHWPAIHVIIECRNLYVDDARDSITY